MKAKKWLSVREQREEFDPLVKAKRVLSLIELLSLMRKQQV